MAPPNTKNGKPEVRVARIESSRLSSLSFSASLPSDVEDDIFVDIDVNGEGHRMGNGGYRKFEVAVGT